MISDGRGRAAVFHGYNSKLHRYKHQKYFLRGMKGQIWHDILLTDFDWKDTVMKMSLGRNLRQQEWALVISNMWTHCTVLTFILIFNLK